MSGVCVWFCSPGECVAGYWFILGNCSEVCPSEDALAEGFSLAWNVAQMLLEKIQDLQVYLSLTCFSRCCRELFSFYFWMGKKWLLGQVEVFSQSSPIWIFHPMDQRGVLDLPGGISVFPCLLICFGLVFFRWSGFCGKLCKPQTFSILMNQLACGGEIDDGLGWQHRGLVLTMSTLSRLHRKQGLGHLATAYLVWHLPQNLFSKYRPLTWTG